MKTTIYKFSVFTLILLLASCAWFRKSDDTEKDDIYVTAENYVTDGVDYFKEGKDSLAVESWKKALQIIPGDAEVHNFVGIAYHKMNILQDAAQAFRTAVELDSTYYEAANNYGYILFLQKKYNQAEENFRLALRHKPDYEPAKKNLHLVQQILEGSLDIQAFKYAEEAAAKEDYQDQIPDYKRAVEINPGYAKAHNNLAVAYYYEDQFDSAYYHLEKAVRLQKDYPEAINNLGYLNRINQKYDVAIKLFLKAITLKPNYIAALNNLGETYYIMKDTDNAKRVFNTVLELDKLDKTALHYLGLLEKKEGD